MEIAKRLMQHYSTKSYQLFFGGIEGRNMNIQCFETWPEYEANRFMGEEALYLRREADAAAPEAVGYCVLDACLDEHGKSNPDVLYLPQEMQGQKIVLTVYVDPCNSIRMRATGGCSRQLDVA